MGRGKKGGKKPLNKSVFTPSCDSVKTPPCDNVKTPPCDSGKMLLCDDGKVLSCDRRFRNYALGSKESSDAVLKAFGYNLEEKNH